MKLYSKMGGKWHYIKRFLIQWRHSLVFSWCLALLSRWEMVENIAFFGGAEAESSPEDHFRGDRTQKDEDFSRFLTLKSSIYIHDLSENFRLES